MLQHKQYSKENEQRNLATEVSGFTKALNLSVSIPLCFSSVALRRTILQRRSRVGFRSFTSFCRERNRHLIHPFSAARAESIGISSSWIDRASFRLQERPDNLILSLLPTNFHPHRSDISLGTPIEPFPEDPRSTWRLCGLASSIPLIDQLNN